MSDESENKFLKKLAEKRAAAGELPSAESPLDKYKDDIPDLDTTPTVSPKEQVLDEFIKILRITDVYSKYCGKTEIKNPGRKEIKVSCPNPDHRDSEASCSLNTIKQIFFCQVCEYGGDIWDIIAWSKGYPVPGYKNDKTLFRQLRVDIGADHGIEVVRGIAGDEYIVSSTPDVSDNKPDAVGHNVVYTPQGSAQAEEEYDREILAKRLYPDIKWRDIVPENTFLREYLNATTIDDVPEEYHFWSGLIALGLAVGRTRTLEDSPEVVPNLFVCLTGGTGTGKSKAKRHLTDILKDNLPYKRDDQPPYGTHVVKGSQSGEVIIKCFTHPLIDPNGKAIGFWPGVRCLIDFEELSDMIGRSKRQGSTLKQTIMNLYDAPRYLSSTSMLHGSVEAELPFGSVLTTTQLKAIKELISRSDDSSGFANRWVYATGVEKTPLAINRIKVDLTRAGGLLRLINTTARTHELVRWDSAAEKLWSDFFYSTIVPFRKNNPEAEIAQRIDLLLKKMFLLFAINSRALIVSSEHVSSVLSMYPYIIESYQITDEQISSTTQGEHQDLILRHIHRMSSQNRGPTANELHKVIKRRVPDVKILRKILEDFVVLGILEEKKMPPGPSGGRPTSCFTVVYGRKGGEFNAQ